MALEGNGGSEQPSSSNNAGQFIAFRKMMEQLLEPMVLDIFPRLIKPMVISTVQRKLKPMVISIVQQVIEPVAEDLFRRVVKEEIQAFEEKLLSGGRQNDVVKERSLRLRFSDEVCGPVQTGTEVKGIKDEPLKVTLVDESEQIVTCGPESKAKVEILLLDANHNDHEDTLTHENFERKIIGEEEKKKPHFAKNVYIRLEDGVGYLTGIKLGHGEDWTKFCNCRLGVRIVQNIRGIIVQEAWTPPFKVIDKRAKLYGKHDQPLLSSEVWRLEKIGKDGEPCRRLKKENIKTVQDFRFWLSVDPEGLQRILRAGDIAWQIIVAHANTCIIYDEKLYSYKSLTEPQISVVYDTVGELKGVIDEGHFVPLDNLSADKKDRAHKLLRSLLDCCAFGDRYKTVFNNESSLLQEVPFRSSYVSTSTISDPTVSGNITTHQTINPSNLYDPGPSVSLRPMDMGELYGPASGPFPDFENNDGGTPTDLGQSITLYDYEKHETPSLFGEVSQLDNICKDGEIHKRLRDNNINTVEEFLIKLLIDHERLREIVNLESQEWEATVSNARACPAGSRMYCYIDLQQKKGVTFNVLGDVLGLCFDNYCYPTSVLSEKQMADAHELLASACKNWSDVKPFNDVNDLQHLSGESSSRRSNASFHSVSSTMECRLSGDDFWDMLLDCRSPSPDPMLHYADDTYSYNTHQMYGQDEGSAATVETTTTNPPNKLKRLSRFFSSFKEKMSLDHKKPKVG